MCTIPTGLPSSTTTSAEIEAEFMASSADATSAAGAIVFGFAVMMSSTRMSRMLSAR